MKLASITATATATAQIAAAPPHTTERKCGTRAQTGRMAASEIGINPSQFCIHRGGAQNAVYY